MGGLGIDTSEPPGFSFGCFLLDVFFWTFSFGCFLLDVFFLAVGGYDINH
jgi:hypothetical protein